MARRALCGRHVRSEQMEAAAACTGATWSGHQRQCVWARLYAGTVRLLVVRVEGCCLCWPPVRSAYGGNGTSVQSEDCLLINIMAPYNASNLPVYIYA